jgi:DNA-binding PadR family transcriptional regulator
MALLREAPMHRYQMQMLLCERRKDELVVLKHASLHQAIHRLERAALIITGSDRTVTTLLLREEYSAELFSIRS